MKIDIDAVVDKIEGIVLEAIVILLDLICPQADVKKTDDSTVRFLRQEFCWDLLDGKYGLAGSLYGLRLMRKGRK